MGEIKSKLNISKITVKNIFLVILLMIVMAVIGVIAKSIGSKVASINTAQAQSCWTPPPVGGGSEGCGSEGYAAGEGGGGESSGGCGSSGE